MAIEDRVQRLVTIAMEIRPALKITTQKEMFEYESYLQTHPNHDHHGTNL